MCFGREDVFLYGLLACLVTGVGAVLMITVGFWILDKIMGQW